MALLDVEAHFLTFVESFVTVAGDCGVMNENVLTAIFWSDETKTFRRVEPLNCTSTQDNTLYQKNNNMDMPFREPEALLLRKPSAQECL
ncbi:hypothetical protein IMCC3135_27350 [Granulosicoccus antarcticus IMCC3135]|uniref:Uncharacterized protein n=1 Tax=Granulosicoccus antarcticus IMCC3135 TaxID=1192854 RepID=A0A2Z2P6P0_9GAMM|nr:hypothetical protein IMCC3135_27350 [Granulosicoccus antarcticus IMCC3135]